MRARAAAEARVGADALVGRTPRQLGVRAFWVQAPGRLRSELLDRLPRRAPCRMIGDLVSADRNLGKREAPLEGTLAARLAVLPLNVPPSSPTDRRTAVTPGCTLSLCGLRPRRLLKYLRTVQRYLPMARGIFSVMAIFIRLFSSIRYL